MRAHMVTVPGDWPWSSYQAHVDAAPTPPWLDTNRLHGYLLGHAPSNAADARRAASRYAELVATAKGMELWPQALTQQIYLGDESFVQRIQAEHLAPQARVSVEVPRAQRSAMPLQAVDVLKRLHQGEERGNLLRQAYRSGMTMTALAAALNLSVSRVSRLVANAERAQAATAPQRATPLTKATPRHGATTA